MRRLSKAAEKSLGTWHLSLHIAIYCPVFSVCVYVYVVRCGGKRTANLMTWPLLIRWWWTMGTRVPVPHSISKEEEEEDMVIEMYRVRSKFASFGRCCALQSDCFPSSRSFSV